jgi:hypothetical protein
VKFKTSKHLPGLINAGSILDISVKLVDRINFFLELEIIPEPTLRNFCMIEDFDLIESLLDTKSSASSITKELTSLLLKNSPNI